MRRHESWATYHVAERDIPLAPTNANKVSEKKAMTIEQAIELLRKEYERAKNMEYVKKPLAWALFQVWKKADQSKTKGREK